MHSLVQMFATFQHEGASQLGQAEGGRRCYAMLLMSIPFAISCYIFILVTELTEEQSSTRLGIQLLLPLCLILTCAVCYWFHELKGYSGLIMVIAISIVLGEEAAMGSRYLSGL